MLAAALEGWPVVWPLCTGDNVSGALSDHSVLIFLPLHHQKSALRRVLPQEMGNLNI